MYAPRRIQHDMAMASGRHGADAAGDGKNRQWQFNQGILGISDAARWASWKSDIRRLSVKLTTKTVLARLPEPFSL